MKRNGECRACEAGAGKPPDQSLSKVFDRLEARLLALGGERLVRQEPAPYAAEVLARGRPFDLPVRRRRGRPNQCHANAADLWAQDVERLRLAAGYGLSEDGLWCQHYWVVGPGRVIETTVVRSRYFGVVLGPKESVLFWWNCFVRVRYAGACSLLCAQAAAELGTAGGTSG